MADELRLPRREPGTNTLYGEADGTLWIGTSSGGLGRLREGKLESFSTADGLFDDKVHRILDDGRGWLWRTRPVEIGLLVRLELVQGSTYPVG